MRKAIILLSVFTGVSTALGLLLFEIGRNPGGAFGATPEEAKICLIAGFVFLFAAIALLIADIIVIVKRYPPTVTSTSAIRPSRSMY